MAESAEHPGGQGPNGRVVLTALISHAMVSIPLLVYERRMRRTGGPGIIAFELAGTPRRARRITRRWGRDGRAAARASLLVDFPYLVTYTVLQNAACWAAGRALQRAEHLRLGNLAGPIAGAQVGAGAFDAIENAALLGVLSGGRPELSYVARSCAQAKFALLIAGWTYGGLGLISHLANRRRT